MGNVMDLVYGAPWNHNESCGNAQIGEWYRLESVYNCDCDNDTQRQQQRLKYYDVSGNHRAIRTTI